jgi:hypothetical protein
MATAQSSHILYFSENMARMIKSRGKKWAGGAWKLNCIKNFGWKPEGEKTTL